MTERLNWTEGFSVSVGQIFDVSVTKYIMTDFQMKFQNSVKMIAQMMYNTFNFLGVQIPKCWIVLVGI